MRKLKYIFLVIISTSLIFSPSKSSEVCREKVIMLHDTLIINSESKDSFKQNFDKLREINRDIFNYEKMIRIIYGRKWKDLSIEDKRRVGSKFLDFISYNYAKRFLNLKNANFFEKDVEEIDTNNILVNTTLNVQGEEPLEISYLCSKNSEDIWTIFDVILNGSISEISTKKSDFSSIIKTEGLNGLINTLDSKIILD